MAMQKRAIFFRDKMAVFAIVIRAHTFNRTDFSIRYFGNRNILFRNKCYSVASMVLNQLYSLSENPMNGKTKTQKTGCERTNWSEAKCSMQNCTQELQDERKRQRKKANTGNTPQLRTTAQTRTANQWMEYNIVWSHAFMEMPFEWVWCVSTGTSWLQTLWRKLRAGDKEEGKSCNTENTIERNVKSRAMDRCVRKTYPKIGYVTKNGHKSYIDF